ncbi:MAG: 23S rRNA (uracil(1939)-C(5))-methyltransferase RlmD, partial [Lachnospiraceae bacterium]|nr:23S rRNA (uracil(1939)-C(5))-methyltransferase RlmD [Lachnospiraceae bacterium]
MKKGQTYEGYVERMDFPNKGIVRVETEEGVEYASVKDALPGRRISFMVNKKRGGKAEGRQTEVLESAACEAGADKCEYSGTCGGCLYQGFPYEESVKVKEEQIKRLLGNYTEGAVYDGVIPSPSYKGYRNKMEYTFGDEYMDGPLAVGLHKRGSFYDILNVPGCEIAPADFGVILDYTLSFFKERGVSHYHRMRHTGILRHLLLRKSHASGEIMAGLVTTSELDAALAEEWCEGLKKCELEGKLASVLHIVNDELADAVKCNRLVLLYGGEYITEELLGLKFRISPFSFFQTNSAGAEKLYSLVREYLMQEGVKGTVFDLYSGTGTISQMISPAAEKVIAVEIVEEAVEAARENAKLNGISNCEFIAADVLKALDDITDRPDYTILDPPRDGINPKALNKILDYGVDSLVYISCKASSLARDMIAIRSAGYEIIRWGMVDMFPFTGNIETVCLLSKGDVKSQKLRVEFSLEDMDTDGFKKGATYNAIRDWIKAKYGYRVTNLNIAQVKQK